MQSIRLAICPCYVGLQNLIIMLLYYVRLILLNTQ
jgi:hypothetical protein